ncbi:Uncharacterised protein [Enterobacter cloacae]|nr:Uncharacterised protein [Enterobacter cloacae]
MGRGHGEVGAVYIANDHGNKDHDQRQVAATPGFCSSNWNIHRNLSPDFGHSEAAHHAL